MMLTNLRSHPKIMLAAGILVAIAVAPLDEVLGSIVSVGHRATGIGAAAAQVLGTASALSRQSHELNGEMDGFLRSVRAA